jgi:hypothetical protein
VYLAALVTNLVFSYAEGQKNILSFDNENIVFQGSTVFCLQPVVLGFHS